MPLLLLLLLLLLLRPGFVTSIQSPSIQSTSIQSIMLAKLSMRYDMVLFVSNNSTDWVGS